MPHQTDPTVYNDNSLHQLLNLIDQCDTVCSAANNEADLLKVLCQKLVESGGYPYAATQTWNGTPESSLLASCGTPPSLTSWAEILALPGDCWQAPVEHLQQQFGELRVAPPRNGHFSADEQAALTQIAHHMGCYLAMLRARLAQEALESSLRQLSRALESSSNGVMITSSTQLDHPIIYVNPAFERITGYTAAEVIGRSGRFLVRDDLNQKGLNDIRDSLRNHREAHAILRNYRRDGRMFWNELHIAPVRDETGGMTTHFVSIINDVSERISYQQQLEYQSTHDALTGLANRNLLNDRIAHAIAMARREKRLMAVMLLDLDRFKLINDGFGHAPADNLLKIVAERLQVCVRDTDTVARLGGDEFVIVATDLATADDISVIAGKIVRGLGQPLIIEDKEIFITASIGVAIYPRDGDHGEALLRNADVAMYRVKENGRNSYRFYAPEMSHMALDRLDMEGGLRRAIERNELVIHYQPLIHVADGRIKGAEALVRWNHPRIGLIQPSEFIPLAEDTGLIIPLGEMVLRQVCQQLALWRQNGYHDITISVNISARQFRQDDLASHISQILEESGIPGEMLEIELTESMVMHDMENTLTTLRQLKSLGISLALDDFGTGYSSLSYLKRFPIDALKIDRSFIRDIETDSDDAAIAHAVIAMAHSLGLRVVAEGVETQAQLDLIKNYVCDYFQGYLFSRPVPAEEFALLMNRSENPA